MPNVKTNIKGIISYKTVISYKNIGWVRFRTHTCNSGTQEAEAKGLGVWDEPALYNEALSQKQVIK